MSRLPIQDQDAGTWGTILNDYLSQSHTTTGLLKENSVTATQIAPGAVTAAALAASAVSNGNIAVGSIDQAKITNLATDLATKIAKSTVTTKGDLLTTTASATVDRLAVGTNGQVLTADSAQTPGVKWATPTAAPVSSVVGQTGVVTGGQIAGDSTVAATYVKQINTDVRNWPGGRIVGWLGASITNGAGSTNSTVYSYRAACAKITGSFYISTAINAGISGETSTQIAARAVATCASAQLLVIGPDFGTNSAGNSITLDQFKIDFKAVVAAAKNAGIPCMACTILPRGSSSTASAISLTRVYNLWLIMTCSQMGIPLADTHGALVDAATGYLGAAYDSGDGVHTSNAGHLAIAQTIAPTLLTLIRNQVWPVKSPGAGLVTNPLMVGAGAAATGWSNLNGTFPTPAFAIVDSTGTDGLPAGRWQSMTLDGSGGVSGYRNLTTTLSSSGWSAGDTLMICCHAKTTQTDTGMKIQLLRESTAGAFMALQDQLVTNPGPTVSYYTVAAGITGLYLSLTGSVSANTNHTFYIGAVDVFNLTRLNCTTIFP